MQSVNSFVDGEMVSLFRRAHFIGRKCATGITWRSPVFPAPCFRREFTVDVAPVHSQIRFCGLGYGELYLDGEKLGDAVLSPTVSIYDRRAGFQVFDLSGKLTPGRHTLAARLGNGWYNAHTAEVWHFDKASWRDAPKLWLELEVDGRMPLTSDESWKVSTGGIRFDGLRNGEWYDATMEPDGWMCNGFDDSGWEAAYLVAPPGGVLEAETAPPCRVIRRIDPVSLTERDGVVIADFGENLTGWCEIEVEAEAGAEFVIRHWEATGVDGLPEEPCVKHLDDYILSGEFQTDHYVAAGKGVESWHPRFTYHGFRYALVSWKGAGRLRGIRAEFVASDMRRIGECRCSDADFSRLTECAVNSFLGNFTGIPTDCPHREKNGWTGDAQLAAATGLYLFDAAANYCHWLDIICDAQRPDGQVASIAPTGGWGFNNASGPVWDSALVLIPYEIYLHTGDKQVLRRYYPNILRYFSYLRSRTQRDGLINFGLADWCSPGNISGNVDCRFASTAYYARILEIAARIARILGASGDGVELDCLSAKVKDAVRRQFHPAPGRWGGGTPTELAMALELGLTSGETERVETARELARTVAASDFTAQFGIVGAKHVPRALAANGYVNHAWKLLTQPNYPGWVNWLRRGATTLWENWEGSASQNHIMFGDFVAFAFEYLGGLRLDEEFAATGILKVRPAYPDELERFAATLTTPHGRVSVEWHKKDGVPELTVDATPGIRLQE